MALVSCPECKKEISNSAAKCIHCGFVVRKPKRGPLGQVFKWIFILFNILMVWWLISYWTEIGSSISEYESEAEQSGAALGGTLGTGMIVTFWALGDVVLGLFVLFTRAKA